MDFTLRKYTELLQKLIDNHYLFLTFEYYCLHKSELKSGRLVILRHDVDLKAENSLKTANIESSFGIKASYYFRVVKQSNKPEIIKAIADLGHEIGYHYEDMTICEGNAEKSIIHFKNQLEYFRKFYPVQTICMHGSPRSRYDGKDLWKKYNYHDYGIMGEPYFDVDFSKLFYMTDTGRCWDGFNVSVRDKIPVHQDRWIGNGWVYHSTDDVIGAIGSKRFPEQIMITTHPQRWTDNYFQWTKELLLQKIKNIVKKIVVSKNFSK